MAKPRGSGPALALSVAGPTLLVISLFLVWSHQLGPAELRRFPGPVTYGVPADPTAWQVYAIAAEVLSALALGVVAAGLWGRRLGRAVALLGVAAGLAFVIHAAGSAPTNGLLLSAGRGDAARYIPDPATAGPGELVALAGLGISALGLLVSFVRLPRRPERDIS